MANITSSFLCLLILFVVCLNSFGYSLHGNKDEELSVDVVSNAKVDAMKKVQLRKTSGEEFSKETTKMTMKKTTKKETSGEEEEDDLVAFTADYWKPRHHPPKNN